MKRWIVSGVAAAAVAVGIVVAARPFARRAHELQADLKTLRGDTGDVMASATYQRFAARRGGVAAMHAALRSVASAESVFVADSGRPTTLFLEDRYHFTNDKSNLGPTIEIQRDRWVAKIGNIHTDIECSLTAMLDTVSWRYHPGTPVCRGWSPEESLGVAR
jgi:hypothetical protein